MSLTPRRNLGLKAVSLVLAYATWAFVVGRSPGVRFINAPLEFATPDNLVVTDYSPREVRVRLQGESPLLDRLSEQNVYARVQLEPTMRTGRAQKIGVQEREILGVPNGISKEIITPSLTVAVERRVTKNVAVRVRTIGSPPQGFRVVQAATEPQTVEISGPEGAVHAVEQVWTEAIDTKNHKRAFTGTIDLVRPDPLVTLKPDNVRVNVFVDEVSRPIEILAPVRSSDAQFVPDPANVRVVLEGPPTLVQRARAAVTAIADASGLPPRGGQVPLQIAFSGFAPDEAARIRIVLTDPARVRLRRP